MRPKYIFLILSVLLSNLVVTSASAQRYAEDYIIEPNRGSYVSQNKRIVSGVLVGVTLPSIVEVDDYLDIRSSLGWGVALQWGIDLGSVEIVPEIWYQRSGSDVELSGDTYRLKSSSVDVPILCALKMGCMRLNLGTSFSLLSSGQIETSKDSYEFGRLRSTVGYIVGLSAILMEHIVVDFRYTGHFIPLDGVWYDNGDVYSYRYSSVGLNLGYRF